MYISIHFKVTVCLAQINWSTWAHDCTVYTKATKAWDNAYSNASIIYIIYISKMQCNINKSNFYQLYCTRTFATIHEGQFHGICITYVIKIINYETVSAKA